MMFVCSGQKCCHNALYQRGRCNCLARIGYHWHSCNESQFHTNRCVSAVNSRYSDRTVNEIARNSEGRCGKTQAREELARTDASSSCRGQGKSFAIEGAQETWQPERARARRRAAAQTM